MRLPAASTNHYGLPQMPLPRPGVKRRLPQAVRAAAHDHGRQFKPWLYLEPQDRRQRPRPIPSLPVCRFLLRPDPDAKRRGGR
jgi:hypothetical protein